MRFTHERLHGGASSEAPLLHVFHVDTLQEFSYNEHGGVVRSVLRHADAQNRPAIVEFNGTKYGYLYNLQGDVIGLIDSANTEVVKYTYDAWGKPLSVTGSLANTIGYYNPFRYRGYVYDVETGLYYLRSRYYNPNWGRFVNADSICRRV